MIPRVLTIAGSDSSGGAGIQADLKTFTVFGVYGMSAITALTAQNTLGVQRRGAGRARSSCARRSTRWRATSASTPPRPACWRTAPIIEAVAAAVRAHRIAPLVVDPVMVAQSGARLLEDDARAALLRELLPLAALVTPNVPEAEALLGMRVASVADMRDAARRLVDAGAGAALVKGGHLDGPRGGRRVLRRHGAARAARAAHRTRATRTAPAA